MDKPNTKEQLVNLIHAGRQRLEQKLSDLTPTEMETPGTMEDWSVKDLLGHLVDWQEHVIQWYQVGLRGEPQQVPAPGYTWRDLPALNALWRERHRNRPLAEVQAEFDVSYQELIAMVAAADDADLFTPRRFAWTGPTWNVAKYVAACSYKHYAWAYKEIRPKRIREILAAA